MAFGLLRRGRAAGNGLGFYRFDSIAQSGENLTDGAVLTGAVANHWTFYETVEEEEEMKMAMPRMSGAHLAQGKLISSSTRGYPPGPCCSPEEVQTIHVHDQMPWYAANVTISYN